MILLLLSGLEGFECPAPLSSAFSPSIDTSSPVSPLLLGWITPCASSGPVPLVASLVSVSCAVLVVMLGRVPDADDPPCETEGWDEGPALRPMQFSSEILTQEGKRNWPSSVCLSLLDPQLRASRLRQPSARLILSSAAASRADPAELPFNRPSILFRHASLRACGLPWPFLRYRHPRRPSLRLAARSLPCEGWSSLPCFPSTLLLGLASVLPASHFSDSGTPLTLS